MAVFKIFACVIILKTIQHLPIRQRVVKSSTIVNNSYFQDMVKRFGSIADAMPAAKKYVMNNKKDTAAKNRKLDTCYCPVCGTPRQKGNHAKCSRITQLKGMRERGEI